MERNINKILEGIPDKGYTFKDTTSLKWKYDVLDFFIDKNLYNCLEIGTWVGYTTKILANVFQEVWSIEFQAQRHKKAQETCKGIDNITLILGDAYSDETYKTFPKSFDAVVIDCDHSYEGVIKDINRGASFIGNSNKIYFVFDDFGHSEQTGVNAAVTHALQSGLTLEKYIGKEPGTIIHRDDNTSFTLMDWEGVIASYEIK